MRLPHLIVTLVLIFAAPAMASAEPTASEPVVDAEWSRAHPALYPLVAFRDGREGDVQIRVDVSAEGRTTWAEVIRSSLDRDMDRRAMESMRTMRFTPAIADGVPVAGHTLVTVRFRMGGRTHSPGMGAEIPAEPPVAPDETR